MRQLSGDTSITVPAAAPWGRFDGRSEVSKGGDGMAEEMAEEIKVKPWANLSPLFWLGIRMII